MNFKETLKEGILRRRYKRFFAEIDFGGETITAHVPNTGSLKGCLKEGAACRFTTSNDPSRKLAHTLQMVRDGKAWVGVNTGASNSLVWEAWLEKRIPHWKNFDAAQREVRINAKTRLDLALWKATDALPATTKLTSSLIEKNKIHFVEVKNVSMAHNGLAMFPDAVTERGQKHLQELMDLRAHGHGAEILFLVQRDDCKMFAPADDIDPDYGKLFRQAIKAGVKISAYPCEMAPDGVHLKAKPLALEI